ncbi:hypothetical protein CerSpe_170900 [Prunus speciosa]
MGYHMGFDVAPVGTAGGLSLWWDTSVSAEIQFSSTNVICSMMKSINTGRLFRAYWIYGTPYREAKNEFWYWMEQSFAPTNHAWFCGGDFNEFLWGHEKSGGSEPSHSRPKFLHNFMSKMALMDLGYVGPCFTWRGRVCSGDLVQERLDRGLVNYEWKTAWPNTTVYHETVVGSDHSPLIVNCEPRSRRSKRLFKFEAN